MRHQSVNSLEPLALPRVNARHYPAIFGDLRDVIRSRVSELGSIQQPYGMQARDLLNHFLDSVDVDAFNELKRDYLKPDHPILGTDRLKYLDSVYWLEGKLRSTLKLNLHETAPLRILDIGTGPGYFPFVAEFFGHSILGTDIPLSDEQSDEPVHLYDRLCGLLTVTKVIDKILPFNECSDFGERFDLVTGFMVAFNVYPDRVPWCIDAWNFFLRSLQNKVLKDSGQLYLNLTNKKVTTEVWAHLVSLATWSNEKRKELFFDRFAISF